MPILCLSIRRMLLVAPLLICLMLFSTSQQRVNAQDKADTSALQLLNPGFEKGMEQWYFQISQQAKGTSNIDREVFHSGKSSLHMTNATAKAPNVFCGVFQVLRHLTPMTQYRLTYWCKANAVKYNWVGGGPDWKIRKGIPFGTYDWKQLELVFETGIDQTQFELRFNVDDVTADIWLDDMQLQAIGPGNPSLGVPSISQDIPAGFAYYPAFEGQSDAPATVRLRDEKDEKFGADIRAHWNEQGLELAISVLDPTRDPIFTDQAMWSSDCIQLGLETQLDQASTLYSATSLELGLTVDKTNSLQQYVWHSGSAQSTSKLDGHGRIHDDGYDVSVTIPWAMLNLSEGKRPDVMGINMVINDGNKGKRRYVQWTDGIAQSKDPSRFAQIQLLNRASTSGYAVVLDEGANKTVDVKKAVLFGRVLCYAAKAMAPQSCMLKVETANNSSQAVLGTLQFPALKAGQCAAIRFAAPAKQMPSLGKLQFTLETKDHQTLARSMPLNVIDYEDSQKNQLQSLSHGLEQLDEAISKHPQLARDSQLNMGRYIVHRFIKRVSENRQPLPWNALQLNEAADVLVKTKARLALLINNPDALYCMTPSTGPITQRDGLLWADDQDGKRPVFLYGYGHFAQVIKDLPNMNTVGATLIQQERGPREMDAKGDVSNAVTRTLQMLDQTHASGVRLELLLSPHYFPQWAVDQAPELMHQLPSGKRFNIDHPMSRKVIAQWLDSFIPSIADHPNLFSLCLANEPTYNCSGIDPFSRPAFNTFLQGRYGSIAKLNEFYRSSYASFDKVPVPDAVGDHAPSAQRLAYYDWVRFNQRHFANWLSWMNTHVKNASSKPMTHIKQMTDIYNRSTFSRGTDPEMISSITDLAGNDSYAYPTPGGTWCYGWHEEQIWYDLLHSFSGQVVFNSENHFILDDSPAQTIAPNLTRSAMWQGMLHHVGASTLWIWDEPVNHDLSGSIYLRPGNIYGAGMAMLQGSQFANELAAFNQQPAQVALLYSYPSIFWEPDHAQTVSEAYTALTMRGSPVTFISEKQLASGERSIANRDVKVLVLPHATHMTEAAVKGLKQWISQGGIVIAIGKNNASYDDFDQQRTALPQMMSTNLNQITEKLAQLPAGLNAVSIPLINTRTNKPAWGVEYRVIKQADRWLITMTNFTNEDQTLNLKLPNAGASTGKDLLSSQPVNLQGITLSPAQSCLLEVGDASPKN